MFVDASAIVAILTYEDEKILFQDKLKSATKILVSPLSLYEAILGVRRKLACSMDRAQDAVAAFTSEVQGEIIAIDEAIGIEAIAAFARYGKGQHRASLNMGDCFAYACARSRNVPLLFKGDDFIHTDVTRA